jgi:hypothetical protein
VSSIKIANIVSFSIQIIPVSNFQPVYEFRFIEPQQHFFTKQQVQSFITDVLVGEDVIIVSGQQSLENPTVQLVFTFNAGVLATAAE